MKVLQAHNYYQLSGGEDVVVANEKALLEENGHEVITYYKHNDEIADYGLKDKFKLFNQTTWSKNTYGEVSALIKREQPDICHLHNFLPLISPSIYDACQDHGIPVVQTLHNYRLICTNGQLYRNDMVCEKCLARSPFQAVTKKCYRDSYLQTLAVARMLYKNQHRWKDSVTTYFCLTDFAKEKFIAHGLPASKLMVKPNFVTPNVGENKKEGYLLYVGRLDQSKGVRIFSKLKLPLPLKIIGEGDFSSELSQIENIELLGTLPNDEVRSYIQKAKALVFPSTWYEGMPMTILEAFASQTPVIASNLGAMSTMIQHQKNGLLFTPESEEELMDCVNHILMHPESAKTIGQHTFVDFKEKYSKEANYQLLMKGYEQALLLKS